MSLARRGSTDNALKCSNGLVGSTCRCLFDRARRVGGGHRVEAVRSQLYGTAFVDPAARSIDLSYMDLDPREPVLDVAKARLDKRLDPEFDIGVAMHVVVTVELE
jgi:hypothetical protein